jgi:16S rRNA processing protein RimM
LDSKRVLLGTCGSVHGIKGAVVFNLFNDESSVLEKGMTVYTNQEAGISYKIADINFSNKVIVYLDGVTTRNESESIIPFDIYLDRNVMPEIDEDEVYLADLIGFEVQNEEKKRVGVVNSFYDHGASEIMVVLLKNGEQLELPFVKAFFPDIDFEKSLITMVNPEII